MYEVCTKYVLTGGGGGRENECNPSQSNLLSLRELENKLGVLSLKRENGRKKLNESFWGCDMMNVHKMDG